MKRIFSLFLSACLALTLLSGCSSPTGESDKTPDGEIPMGRYVEEQGETLENLRQVYDFKNTEDGGFSFFGSIPLEENSGKSEFNLYTVPAGSGPITSETVPGLTEFAPTGVRDMAQGSDGTLYLLYYNVGNSLQMGVAKSVNGGDFEPIEVADLKTPTSGGASSGYVTNIGGSDGASVSMGGITSGDEGEAALAPTYDTEPEEETDAPEAETEEPGSFTFVENSMPDKIASGIRAMDDGGFLVLYGNKGVSRYAADGTLQGEYPGTAYNYGAVVKGNTLLMSSADGAAVWSYDLAANKQDGTYTYDNMGFGTQMNMDDENIYLADSTGIYRQARGSTIWEKLVDGDLTSLVMPNLSITGFAPDGKGGFGALLGSTDATQFVRYTYSATTPTTPDTELTIFSLRSNNTIRQAIGEFQRRNPNVRVNFRVGLDDAGSATAEDVIRTLNTELLAGKGPDLILLDGLNPDTYIEKGVLADLTEFVKGQSGLLSNLTNAYEKDGKIYGVPSRFTFPVMMGRAADVAAMDSLQALVERVVSDQGGEPMFLRRPEKLWAEDGVGMMMDYYDAMANSFQKEGGALDEDGLATFFAAMQTLDKTVKEHAPQSDGTTAFVTMAISAGSAAGFESINMGPSDLNAGRALFHTQEMSGVFAVQFVSQNLGGMEGQKLAPLFGGNAYTPRGGVGLNAAGKQQELALGFLEMLLSATVQDNYLYDGYPVRSDSLQKLVDNTLGEESNGDMGFMDICTTLETPLLTDAVIKDTVQAQMKGIMDGSMTPQQAAANVVEKTQLYLSE